VGKRDVQQKGKSCQGPIYMKVHFLSKETRKRNFLQIQKSENKNLTSGNLINVFQLSITNMGKKKKEKRKEGKEGRQKRKKKKSQKNQKGGLRKICDTAPKNSWGKGVRDRRGETSKRC